MAENFDCWLFPEEELPKGEDPEVADSRASKTREAVFNDYEGFVDKFKPKKTTDDCYTPEPIYQAVLGWINDHILPLEGVDVVRPFWPGGDFEKFDYPQDCIVIDNPPFSILARIRRFYHSRGIRYFLFAPALTLASSARELPATYIVCGQTITYANGAKVSTSFITNLDCGDTGIWVAGSLAKAIWRVEASLKATKPQNLYQYPKTVASAAQLQKIAIAGGGTKAAETEPPPYQHARQPTQKGEDSLWRGMADFGAGSGGAGSGGAGSGGAGSAKGMSVLGFVG